MLCVHRLSQTHLVFNYTTIWAQSFTETTKPLHLTTRRKPHLLSWFVLSFGFFLLFSFLLPGSPFQHNSICLYLSVSLPMSLSVRRHVCISVCLSVRLSVCLCLSLSLSRSPPPPTSLLFLSESCPLVSCDKSAQDLAIKSINKGCPHPSGHLGPANPTPFS